jgi:uncharacterized protein YutE (UPF0331/DUF86 family)
MPDFNYAKGRVKESLQFIAAELSEFEKDYSSKAWADYQKDNKLQKLIDRTVENILTALIEVSGTILVQESIPVEQYSQVLRDCAKYLQFADSERDEFAKLAILRNRFAHRYLNFKWQSITYFKNAVPLIKKFTGKILEREGGR